MADARPPKGRGVRAEELPEGGLTLDELCDLAGVTIRTVRYYISEGLLPPPGGHGTTAHYTREHLDRLTMIGAMKERFLPLKEIRRALDQMGEAEIAVAAKAAVPSQAPMDRSTRMASRPARGARSDGRIDEQFMSPLSTPSWEMREESSAADYIADVLEHRSGGTKRLSDRQPPLVPEASSWRRIAISEDAELLIEEGAYRRRREQIESLVTWAQRILKGT